MKKKDYRTGAKDRALFNDIACDYFKKDLFAPSAIARKFRLEQTLKLANSQSYKKILEVGCGGGFTAHYLKNYYSEYTGIDYSEKMIAYARSHSDIFPGVSFLSLDIKDLEAHYNDFDMVLMIGVLHHMENMAQALIKLRSHLKPGGLLVINEPQSGNPLISLLRRWRKRLDPSYSTDQRELSSKTLLKTISDAGYVNIQMHPQGFFSTPFAEVMLRPEILMMPLSILACKMDYLLEKYFTRYLTRLSWNLVLTAENPGTNN